MRYRTSMRIRTYLKVLYAIVVASSLVYLLLWKLLITENRSHKIFSIEETGPWRLLERLGFIAEPDLYPERQLENVPVLVSAVSASHYHEFEGLLETKKKHHHDRRLIVYDLGLEDSQKEQMLAVKGCEVRAVHWEKYPPHVQDLYNYAFKPILIQEALQEFGAIFWCDASVRFNNSNLISVLTKVDDVGLAAWPIPPPTSALTHHSMFRYFKTTPENYYFHRMVEPGKLVLYNTELIHEGLMLPWVKCALDLECIAPRGSSRLGCNFNRKPRYLYAGCHRYDMSALNVILGLLFHFETPYIHKAGDNILLPDHRSLVSELADPYYIP